MKYNAVKGVQDVFPPDVFLWQRLEAVAGEVFGAYGFRELRAPIMEYTQVFTRSIGETSDIVEKEMYTFNDKGGRSISLRPEGTAPIVRCYVQNHLHTLPSPQKYYYMGPMFRYERPQRGRLRQFHQIGVEAFGEPGPAIDAEVVSMLWSYLERLGVKGLELELNSLGCPECRPHYTKALTEFFTSRSGDLCEDCHRRLGANPLRILDCKTPKCGELKPLAPSIDQFHCPECKAHFKALQELLDKLDVPFKINPHLVRGLDYYTRTAFEVTSGELGAQNAVAAGGRYDGLVRQFGGPQTPAIGFALGMERMVELLRADSPEPQGPAAYLASIGARAATETVIIARDLRKKGIWAEVGTAGSSLKSQMRRADKLGACMVFFIGDDELESGRAGWKNLRDGTEGEVSLGGIAGFLGASKERC